MDIAVAEKVFGCTVSREYPATILKIPVCGCGQHGWSNGVVPRFSTSKSDSLMVLEKLQELAAARNLWGPQLDVRVPLKPTHQWVVELWNDTHGGMSEPHSHTRIWAGLGETMALAICRAALNAVDA